MLRGVGRDRLAWAADLGATEELRVARAGLAAEIVMLPVGTEVVGLCGADADGDGDKDLMFNTRTHLAPMFVRNHNPAIPAFATAIDWNLATVDDDPTLTSAVASNNNCPPLFSDLNGDGKADLFVALEQTGQVLDQAPAAVYMPWKPTPGYPLTTDWLDGGLYSTPDAGNVRKLALKLAPSMIPTVGEETANALEVIVYRQERRNGILEQNAIAWQIYDIRTILTQAPNHFRVSVDIQDDDCFASQIAGETNLYWFEIWPRLVDWDSPGASSGTPTVIRNFARRFFGIGANNLDVCDYLCDEEGVADAMNDPYGGFSGAYCSTAGPSANWGCVEVEGEGTTQGPAAVIRVRLPARNAATVLPGGNPVLVQCGSCIVY